MKYIRDFITVLVTLLMYIVLLPYKFLIRTRFENKKIFKYSDKIMIVSDHVSLFDPWLLMIALPPRFILTKLPVRILAKHPKKLPAKNKFEELIVQTKIIDVIYWLYQCIYPLNEGTIEEKISPFQNEIDKDYTTLIFPEGKFRMGPGIGIIRPGIAVLRKSNPELPFVFAVIKKDKKFLGILMRFKISFSDLSYESPDEYQLYVKDRLERMLSDLI